MPVVFGTEVRQFVLLPVRPDVFNRVEVWRIGRQILLVNHAAILILVVADLLYR